MFNQLVIESIRKINAERSSSAVYHILTGKRSSQTLQDVRIYQLTGFFGIYKQLAKKDFDVRMEELVNKHYIYCVSEDRYLLTEAGVSCWTTNRALTDSKQWNGLLYDNVAENLYERLLLFIQTVTNIEMNNHSFIPVIENQDTLRWVKQYYLHEKDKLRSHLNQLYLEILSFLETLPEKEAAVFVDGLTGRDKIGLSKEQIAQKYEMDLLDVQVMRMFTIHKLLNYILSAKRPVPILLRFVKDLNHHFFMTESARVTSNLLKKGLGMEEIARMRRLKESTIQDHIIEVAYADPAFPLDTYVTSKEEKEIMKTAKTLRTRRLKSLKEGLAEKYSYFQIRLVLAVNEETWRKEKAE